MLALAAVAPGLTCGQASGQSDIDRRSAEIINRCIEAMGGEMTLSAVETVHLKGKHSTLHMHDGAMSTSTDNMEIRIHGALGQNSDIDDRSREIIEACIDAMGTEMALAGCAMFEVQGHFRTTADVPAELAQPIPFLIKVKDGNIWISIHNGAMITVANSTHTWRTVPGVHGPMLVKDKPDLTLERHFPWPHNIARWPRFDGTVRKIGEITVGGRELIQLDFETPDGITVHRYFDAESKLMTRQHAEHLIYCFEYEDVDGVSLVTRQTIINNGKIIHEADYNYNFKVNIDDEIFDMPDEVKQQIANSDDGRQKQEQR